MSSRKEKNGEFDRNLRKKPMEGKDVHNLLMQFLRLCTIITKKNEIIRLSAGVLQEEAAMTKKILIVEDDINIRSLLQMYLEQEGFQVEVAGDGAEGLRVFKRVHPDLVLLDLMMPVMDGTQMMRELRSFSQVPVVVITARSDTFDKIALLELGADDYVTKPFETREVIASVRAVLRRYCSEEPSRKLEFDNLSIDKESYNIVVKGNRMEIPPKEIELLYFLASSPNRVFTRAQLLDDVWGFDYFGDTRTVDVHIKRLREKLQGVSEQWEIKTVWGVGYKFELNDRA